MQITLSKSLSVNDKLQIKGSGLLDLPAASVIFLDTNMVLPAIFPEEMRNPNVISSYVERINSKNIKNRFYWRSREVEINRKRIRIIKAVETGEFKRCGLYPGLTSPVYKDLRTFEEMMKTGNIEMWRNEMSDRIYDVSVSVEDLRGCNKSVSEAFPGQTDFSVAASSYLLGCDLATNDYISFSNNSMRRFENAYFERWGSKKRFLRHDVDSLLMLLSKN